MAPPKVVVVEDEIELRENLVDLLEFKGCNVSVYSSGEEFIDQLDGMNPDLVFIDYQMPGISGVEATEKAKAIYPNLPVVLVTASSQPSTREEAARVGVNKLIIKPYAPQDIFDTLDEFAPNP